MPSRKEDRSRLEQGQRDTEIRRETAVRGSMGTPASDRDTAKVTPESDAFKDQRAERPSPEDVRGSSPSESRRPQRTPGRLPLPD